MSNSLHGYRHGQYRYSVMLEQGEKSCRRVDYRDRQGRLMFRVWSYESDGQADQIMYSALEGAEMGILKTPDSFLNFTPASES